MSAHNIHTHTQERERGSGREVGGKTKRARHWRLNTLFSNLTHSLATPQHTCQAEEHGEIVRKLWEDTKTRTTCLKFGSSLRKMLLSGTEWVQGLSVHNKEEHKDEKSGDVKAHGKNKDLTNGRGSAGACLCVHVIFFFSSLWQTRLLCGTTEAHCMFVSVCVCLCLGLFACLCTCLRLDLCACACVTRVVGVFNRVCAVAKADYEDSTRKLYGKNEEAGQTFNDKSADADAIGSQVCLHACVRGSFVFLLGSRRLDRP